MDGCQIFDNPEIFQNAVSIVRNDKKRHIFERVSANLDGVNCLNCRSCFFLRIAGQREAQQ